MKILIYKWGSVSEPLFCEALRELHIEYMEFAKEMKNYHYDANFAQEFITALHKDKINAVFSYDYFPLIAMLCEINRIPYISWIYDCPMRTLQSKTLISKYNFIFCFDKNYTQYLRKQGAVNCIHYPLAGDLRMLGRTTGKNEENTEKYSCDISFIGNLYNGSNNQFRQVALPECALQWIEDLLQHQTMNYKENKIKRALAEREDIVQIVVDECGLRLGNEYIQDNLQMVADTLGREVSARERELVLKTISDYWPIHLYTASEVPISMRNSNLYKMGYADYEKEMPLIFQNSRINLNITSRTIETGIPQRIFDILSCGGFCLTNYQEEIAEYFEDGKELVMFYDQEDLIAKVNYYLENEEERKKIAQNGKRKITTCFELKDRIKGLLEYVNR